MKYSYNEAGEQLARPADLNRLVAYNFAWSETRETTFFTESNFVNTQVWNYLSAEAGE